MFLHLSVSHSVHRGGGSTWAGTPWAGTSPEQVHPLSGYAPQAGTPPGQVHPPPQWMLGYGQQAGGTHPTGMHSCYINVFTLEFAYREGIAREG